MAYKSPMAAMKTPASAHSHNLSTSSQPSNTPLLAHTFAEGTLNLDSPSAALMAFSQSHGLTPLPSGLDGLGLQSSPARQAGISRNTEVDKVQRLQDVASLLHKRVAGRGVTRAGVVTVAQSSGFTTYWDEDLLTVAGNCVDLEIMFDSGGKDNVKDVVLKISASGSDERQEEASEILKRDLAQRPSASSLDPWNMLDGFAENIGRLRQLDKLSETVNCFEAVDGLYDAFRQVWEEEKKRLTWRSELHHICGGSLGRARMNKRRKLGVAVDYWVSRHELRAAVHHGQGIEDSTDDNMIDVGDSSDSQNSYWSTRISCEAGFPSLRVSREWLASEIVISDGSQETQAHRSTPLKPAWKTLDSADGATSGVKNDEEPTKNDSDNASSLAAINAHFTFTLDPPLYLPLGIVDAIVARGLLLTTDRSKVTNYKQVLHAEGPPRWLRLVDTYDNSGVKNSWRHSYKLSASRPECYPIDTVGFAHPSQLSSLVPMFRQYACLWSVLQKLTANPVATDETTQPQDMPNRRSQNTQANGIQKRSNVKSPMPKNETVDAAVDSSKIDVTLSFVEAPPFIKPKIEVYVPLRSSREGSPRQQWFCHAAFDIDENGKLNLLSTQIPGMGSENAKQSAGRILTLSEDISTLVEWMLNKAGG